VKAPESIVIKEWIKAITPLFVGIIAGFLLGSLGLLNDCYTPISTIPVIDQSPLPAYCNNELMSILVVFITNYVRVLIIEGFLIFIWQIVGRLGNFKKASDIKTKWYFILPLTISIILLIIKLLMF